MIDKKVEEEIKNLFLNKNYEEVIQFSEKYTVPYKRPSSLSNLIGISKIVKKNVSETDVQSVALAAVFKADPINNFTLFGKVGQNLLHAHDDISDGTGNGVTEINMYYGLGASYTTAEGFDVRLEYEEFGTAGGTDAIRSDRPDQVCLLYTSDAADD